MSSIENIERKNEIHDREDLGPIFFVWMQCNAVNERTDALEI